MKKVIKVIAILFSFLIISFSAWHLTQGQSIVNPENKNVDFKGKILAASDADMISGAYANGILNKVPGIEDRLTLLGYDHDTPKVYNQLFASNSVISWPAILEWNPQQKLAYVAETRSTYGGQSQKMNNVFVDFPTGRKITVINYEDEGNPQVVQEKDIGENIQGVTVNREGTLLASGSTERGKELVIMKLENGRISGSYYFTNPHVKAEDEGNGGIRTVEFHPFKNIIAANLNNTHLVFYEIMTNGDRVDARQLGAALEVGKRWSVGNWHPSGNYFILSDLAWGDGLGLIFHGKGSLVSVAFKNDGSHEIVGTSKVGLSPEGFDISPNGEYAVTVNMRRTWAPNKGFWFVPAQKSSSLSLVKIDALTGKLKKVGEDYGFYGALPEDAVFDAESNSLAVAVYQDRREDHPKEGWVDFWELENDRLIYTGRKIPITRGVHNLLLINN